MYKLVGVLPAAVESTNGGTPGALSYNKTPTATNLLVCLAAVGGVATQPATPAGWTAGPGNNGTLSSVVLFYKIAAGGDAVPSFAAITSATQAFLLAEFSGNPVVNLAPSSGGSTATTSPDTVTIAARDVLPGQLAFFVNVAWYSAAGTVSNTITMSNGATVSGKNNSGTSDQMHYNLGYGITTSNAAATSITRTFTTTNISGSSGEVASFPLPPPTFTPYRMPLGA